MKTHHIKPQQKLTTSKKNILCLVLAAYLLVAMGLFSWLPFFLFQHSDNHKATVQDSGYMEVWTMHHVDSPQHDLENNLEHNHEHQHSHEHHISSVAHSAIHDVPDHVLDIPSDDFIKYMLKVAIQAETLTIFSGVLLLWAFITLLKFFIPRDTGRVPVFSYPLRNSIPILTRTVVLRH